MREGDKMVLPEIPPEQLARNARGLALAAFGSVELIARLLGCDRDEAASFQADAVVHFNRLRSAAREAGRR